ncbi:Protein kinase-like domain [Cordyceps militaris CM01]|uniref:EKC/KEOPS complex subunit BUD32 n=1 Tax=Cordyceps militaris (strain CM01) TaxID=983644 RepID=G3J9I5_CORMM|nr:Protein kinase-like domain [Cordyceps militaris CM01]EGX94962.1 Protein kinase-like domain [Cordyceps militaris CM01]
MSTEPALQSLQNKLKENCYRDVGGFFRYFEDQSWSATVQNILHRPETADLVEELSASLWDLRRLDAMDEWFATFQSLFFAADHPTVRLRSEPIITSSSSYQASIHIGSHHFSAASGSTRIYGEYHHGAAPISSTDDDDFLRFAERALRVFNAQPARYFLHAFLIRGKTLELWVFDRSGAYSSGVLDIARDPNLPLRVLAGYGMMSDQESGMNMLIKSLGPGDVGRGTVCFAASASAATEPTIVVKFSWRVDTTPVELRVLERARDRKVWGVLRLLECKDLVNVADLRHALDFPRLYVNRTLSCVITEPLGRPIRQFVSLYELLEVFRDLVKALKSLYIDGSILHRDIAIKNLVIATKYNEDTSKGILIDFDLALDLDEAPAVQQMVGSDGFMAIGILSGQPHTYRHDLESLFYVFLWLAIGNDCEHDHAHEILQTLPKTSRLWKWCSMDFNDVRQAKVADMSPDGFEHILNEFSARFAPLCGLATELHRLIFPIRDGGIFTKTETDQAAVERLYQGIGDAFNHSILALKD